MTPTVKSVRESTNSVLKYQAKNRCGITVLVVSLISLISMAASAGDVTVATASLGSTSAENSLLAVRSMELSGAVIGHVNVRNNNVFDLDDPEENKALYRIANKIHATTRQDVIAQQLLFSPGERFSLQSLEESERLLRANRYIQDASVRPIIGQDGAVDIEVETTDVWTLMPKLAFACQGSCHRSRQTR